MHFAKLSTNVVKLAEKAFVKRAVVLSFFVPITIGLFTIFFPAKTAPRRARAYWYVLGLGLVCT